MHILIATDGSLDPAVVTRFAGPWAADGGRVTVLTVVEIPRRLLTDMRTAFGETPPPTVPSDAEYIGVKGSGSGPAGWPGDEEILASFLRQRESEKCKPIVDALTAAGISATSEVAESENAATAILDYARSERVDALVVGSHGEGIFEGLLGSTGTKIARLAPCPVLVIRD